MKNIRRITSPTLLSLLLIASISVFNIIPQTTHADSTNGKIVFVSNRDGNSSTDIFSMDSDGTNVINITNDPSYEDYPSVSLDDSKIVFMSDRDNPNGELYSMDINGNNIVRLTNNNDGKSHPSWSPDGSKIIFSTYNIASDNNEVYIMNADGSNQVNITNNASVEEYPSWSPDGSKILFGSDRDSGDGGDIEVYTMNADGSGVARMTNSPGQDRYPSWSPNGTKISFYSQRDGSGEIFTMNADGGNQVNVTNTPGDFEIYSSWSPDSTKIVYETIAAGYFEMYTMNADGGNQVNVTNTPNTYYSPPSWYGPYSAQGNTDSDSDSTSDATEAAGPNGGDANADGIPDNTQANVTTLANPLTGSYVSVVSNCPSNDSVGVIGENNDFKDVAFDYPAGLVNFSLTCPMGSTAAMTLFFFGTLPQNPIARKYNSIKHTYQVIEGSTVSQTVIGGIAAAKVQYQITDGGSLDQDETANGTIVDPVGLAQSVFGAPNTGRGGSALRP